MAAWHIQKRLHKPAEFGSFLSRLDAISREINETAATLFILNRFERIQQIKYLFGMKEINKKDHFIHFKGEKFGANKIQLVPFYWVFYLKNRGSGQVPARGTVGTGPKIKELYST